MQQDVNMTAFVRPVLANLGVRPCAALTTNPVGDELYHPACGARRLHVEETAFFPMHSYVAVGRHSDHHCSLCGLDKLNRLQCSDALAVPAGAVAGTAPSVWREFGQGTGTTLI